MMSPGLFFSFQNNDHVGFQKKHSREADKHIGLLPLLLKGF